jgi:hypothetical protein
MASTAEVTFKRKFAADAERAVKLNCLGSNTLSRFS